MDRVNSEIISPSVCTICHQSFPNVTQLERHTRRKHPKTKYLKCKICKKVFSQNSDLKEHVYSHMDVKKFICFVCEEKFIDRESMLNHIIIVHKCGEYYTCNICRKSFSYDQINDGIHCIHIPSDLMYYSVSNPLKALKIFTIGEPVAVCVFCGKQFTVLKAFERHMESAHGFKVPCECDDCNKSFTNLLCFSAHMASHFKNNN